MRQVGTEKVKFQDGVRLGFGDLGKGHSTVLTYLAGAMLLTRTQLFILFCSVVVLF